MEGFEDYTKKKLIEIVQRNLNEIYALRSNIEELEKEILKVKAKAFDYMTKQK